MSARVAFLPRGRALAMWLSAMALATAGATAPARAEGPPAFAAQGLEPLYTESAAYGEGGTPFRFNPAGSSVRYPSELSLAYVDDPFGRARLAGAAEAHGFRFALAGSEHDPLAWSLGLAGGGEGLRQGIAATFLPAAGGGHAADWRYGLLSRPAPWASLGAVADHLGQPSVGSARLDRTYDVALGLRPLALSSGAATTLGTRLTLTADVRLAESQHPHDAAFRAGAELEAIPGLVLHGSIEDRGRGFRVGVAFTGLRSRIDALSSYDRNSDRRGDVYVASVHAGEDRPLLAGAAGRRVAVVRMAGVLGDEDLSGFSFDGVTHTTEVAPIRRELQRALEDPLTRGVLLDLRGVANMAQLEELRAQVHALRAAGKPVVAYLEYGARRGDLYLAAACDRIVTTPEAFYAGLGLLVQERYYRSAFEALGVRVDRTSYGKYKSAYREFSVDSSTAADRESLNQLLDQSQELFVSAVATDRHMDRGALLQILDGRSWRATQLRAMGLVDSVAYRPEAVAMLGRLAGLGPHPHRVRLEDHAPATTAWTLPSPVAIVYASGSIDTGPSGNDLLMGPYMGSETMERQITAAFRNPAVKAVVLRVESGGGSSNASDLIQHALARMKAETHKPLVVSMGRDAASGGYNIALPGDVLLADRYTFTGSIGVLYLRPSFEGFYRKHDVHEEDFQRGDNMRGWSQGRDWDASMQALADSSVRREYRDFVSLVAASRNLPWDEAEAAAQGRVWMADDAVRLRLIDRIGGLDAAVLEARHRAGVPDGEKIRLLEYRRPQAGFLQRTAGSLVRETIGRSLEMPPPGAPLQWDGGVPIGE